MYVYFFIHYFAIFFARGKVAKWQSGKVRCLLLMPRCDASLLQVLFDGFRVCRCGLVRSRDFRI